MRKLRVGIWLFHIEKSIGGGFSYYERIINEIDKYNFTNVDFSFVTYEDKISFSTNKRIIKLEKYKKDKLLIYLIRKIVFYVSILLGIKSYKLDYKKPYKHYQNKISKQLSSEIDLIYYLVPSAPIVFFPYVYTIWDIGHLSTYNFPELSDFKNYLKREEKFNLESKMAFAIICESNTGKLDLQKYLNIFEKKIFVIPMFPSKIVDIDVIPSKVPELLNKNFIIYPAQFWPHKNHRNLLFAFKNVLQKFPDLILVLTGSDQGNKCYVQNLIEYLNLSSRVLNLGFIEIERLKWLYLNCSAFVFPSFLGPTNMPLVEAKYFGCKIACSNLAGHIEQLGEYPLYFDPSNIYEIEKSIINLLEFDFEKQTAKCSSSILNTYKELDKVFESLSEYSKLLG